MARNVEYDEEEKSEGRDVRSYMKDFATGYKFTYEDQDMGEEEVECGYKTLGDLDLDDMFGAFVEPNYGLVGGACTVDDYSEEGVTDRKGSNQASPQNELGEVGGATGNKGSRRYP